MQTGPSGFSHPDCPFTSVKFDEDPYEEGVIWNVDVSSPLPGTTPTSKPDAVYLSLDNLPEELTIIRDTIFPPHAKVPTQGSNPWYLFRQIEDMFSVLNGMKSPFPGKIEFTRLREVRAEYMIWNQEIDANLEKGDVRTSPKVFLNDGSTGKYLYVFFDIIEAVDSSLPQDQILEKAILVHKKWNALNIVLDRARVEDVRINEENAKNRAEQGKSFWSFVNGGGSFE